MLLPLTVEEYKSNPLGGDTNPPGGDAEIYRVIETATRLMNAATNNWLLYSTAPEEVHKVRYAPDGSLYFRLRSKPVRVIQGITLLVGSFGGSRQPFGFSSTPVENKPQPLVQGQIILNPDASSIRVMGPQLLYAPPGLGVLWNAPVAIAYTRGFDDGTVQSDGVSLPYPDWVRDACRITVRKLLAEAKRARTGRALAGNYRTGDVQYMFKEDVDASLPKEVIVMLSGEMQHWTIGS